MKTGYGVKIAKVAQWKDEELKIQKSKITKDYEKGNLQQCFRNTVYHSMAEVGNDAKLMRFFINNMKIANCDGYAKMMLVNIMRYYGLVAQVTQYG